MKTTVTLDKRPGFFRPRASIVVELEDWERNLIHPAIDLDFWVEKVISFHQFETVEKDVINGEDRSGYSNRAYVGWDKKRGKWTWEGFLPWKPGERTLADYPELEQLAQHIQDKVSQILTLAIESAGIKQTKELPPPEEYKKRAAAIKFAALAKEG
jgi:hypothetical protein